ncbi:MAG: hypothetical protein QOI24_1252 [Acidobacteriota bacterium]|jgi:hypothetical protein|nr:hypothetical protein [Acidobacteriota bacterium]
MKFFYADSQDLVDPHFDFVREEWGRDRLRNRDDVYAHELFSIPPYDGLLVSKAIVDGMGNGSRYTLAQRHRFYRQGVREFFRIPASWTTFQIMGDCGAFSYVKQAQPPFTVDEVLDYYANGRFDLGLSVDHVILEYQPTWDALGVPTEVRDRQTLTLDLADQFLRRHAERRLRFTPVGVAQGWSPASYAYAVGTLQSLGYEYIALGGMVPLRTSAIVDVLREVSSILRPNVQLHLLGVTRVEEVTAFASFGVVSFDTTSPLRQAFKDDHDNYWTMRSAYTAIRIPQLEGNPGLMKLIRSGAVKQEEAARLERGCRDAMHGFAHRITPIQEVLALLREYEDLYAPGKNHSEAYRRVLEERPWDDCPCDVCKAIGYHVVVFRGAERNRRRGFHNLWVFRRRLHASLGRDATQPDQLLCAPVGAV